MVSRRPVVDPSHTSMASPGGARLVCLLLSSRTLFAIIKAVTVNRNSDPGLGLIALLVLSLARYSSERITTLCETWAKNTPHSSAQESTQLTT